MNLIEIGQIKLAPNRQRREFKLASIAELAESIKQNGLLHAPVLRFKDNEFWLVAGERRLRAIQDIIDLGGRFTYGGQPVPGGQVPYNNLGELSEFDARTAELEENIRRVDLTWQERAIATDELMELRTLQAEAAGAPLPTASDISQEIGRSALGSGRDETKKELILAKYMDDPEVRAAPTASEAYKLLKRKEEAAKNTLMARSVGQTFTSAEHRLLNADCLEEMQALSAGQFSVIITDPPYGMGADEFGDSGGQTAGAHEYKDDSASWYGMMSRVPGELFRLAAEQAHAYIFCDIDKFTALRDLMQTAGWRVFRTPLIWFKPAAYRAPWPEHGPQRKYELILFAIKGDRRVNMLAGDVLTFPPDENLGHGAQKPVALYAELLARSAKPGDQVFDPFAGTGPILEAAHSKLCRATAIERDETFYGIAAGRLKGLV